MTTQTTTTTDKADILRTIQPIANGRRWTHHMDAGWVCIVMRDNRLIVEAAWPTMSGEDDEPGSQMCGCPWSGGNGSGGSTHAHYELDVSSHDEAAELAARAIQTLAHRQPLDTSDGWVRV